MLNNLPASFGGGAPRASASRPATPTETASLFGRNSAADRPRTISFSFDWARGKEDKKSESLSYLTQWSAYGEGLPHLRTSRWKHFVALLVLSRHKRSVRRCSLNNEARPSSDATFVVSAVPGPLSVTRWAAACNEVHTRLV